MGGNPTRSRIFRIRVAASWFSLSRQYPLAMMKRVFTHMALTTHRDSPRDLKFFFVDAHRVAAPHLQTFGERRHRFGVLVRPPLYGAVGHPAPFSSSMVSAALSGDTPLATLPQGGRDHIFRIVRPLKAGPVGEPAATLDARVALNAGAATFGRSHSLQRTALAPGHVGAPAMPAPPFRQVKPCKPLL